MATQDKPGTAPEPDATSTPREADSTSASPEPGSSGNPPTNRGPSRRMLIAGGAAAAVAATVGGTAALVGGRSESGSSGRGSLKPGQRNLIMFYVDDLRDWVGYLDSHPGVHTPNIDALAAESFRFDRAYCTVPSCLGSRASTLWGITPEKTGVQRAFAPLIKPLEASDRRTIPEVLSAAGWTTYNSGKVFHNALPDRWDVSRPYPEIEDFINKATPEYKATLFDYGPLPDGEKHIDQATTDWFIDQIADPSLPFFMAVGLYQPHVPWRIPQWALDLHPLDEVVIPEVNCPDDLLDVPPVGQEIAAKPVIELGEKSTSQFEIVERSGRERELVQAYLAACTHTDDMVGQLMDALASSPHNDTTDVVLVSDHGYHLGEKLHWRKSTLWEQASRVPLLIRNPSLAAGGVFDSPVNLVDLAPTFVDMAGADTYDGFDGNSLLGADQEYADAHPSITYWERSRSVRWQNWRYTRYSDNTEELYDLDSDPSECTNIASETANAQMLTSLSAMLDAAPS